MLQPPSKSINIDSAFERACASTQVEPNYCEKAQKESAGKIKVNEHKQSNNVIYTTLAALQPTYDHS